MSLVKAASCRLIVQFPVVLKSCFWGLPTDCVQNGRFPVVFRSFCFYKLSADFRVKPQVRGLLPTDCVYFGRFQLLFSINYVRKIHYIYN